MRLEQIVAQLGGRLIGDGSVEILQVGALSSAGRGQISFLTNPKYRAQLKTTRASAVIVSEKNTGDTEIPRIVHANPYAYYARVIVLLNPPPTRAQRVHETAVVLSPLPVSVTIDAHVVVGRGVCLGENVVLYPGCVIGDDVSIGADTVIYPNVVIYPRCVIGARTIIHAGAVIGSDGFGFAKEGER